MIAVTSGRPVGVDVELIHRVRDYQGLAERFFAPEEIRRLSTLQVQERELAFLRCWTRKEAILKAVGSGLSTPLDQVAVTLSAEDPPQVLRADFEPAGSWDLAHLEPAPEYVGAIALQGELGEVGPWEWKV